MRGAHATSHRPLVEEIVDLAGGLGADPRHLGEVGGGGTLDRLERPEVAEQRTLAGRPDAGDLLQTRFADIAPSPCAVRPDGEPVRLVAQPLNEIQQRVAWLELERLAPGHEERLLASVAIGTLGDGDERYVGDPERGERVVRGGELAATAVDQHETRPR